MRILLKLVLDCDANAAWRALHSPRALAELYGPLVQLAPLTARPPSMIEPGMDVPVRVMLGPVALGDQLIHLSERFTDDRDGAVRIIRDSGMPLTGPLAALEVWDHQVAVSPASDAQSRTFWRERLVIGGAAAVPLWPVLWSAWQCRRIRLRQLAPTWAYDPDASDAEPTHPRGHRASS